MCHIRTLPLSITLDYPSPCSYQFHSNSDSQGSLFLYMQTVVLHHFTSLLDLDNDVNINACIVYNEQLENHINNNQYDMILIHLYTNVS